MNIVYSGRPTRARATVVATVLVIVGLLVFLTQSAPAHAGASGPAHSKPTIVLEHGAWADASSWNGVIPILQHEGYTVYAPPDPLRSLPGDSA
jgi:hypothetical protein